MPVFALCYYVKKGAILIYTIIIIIIIKFPLHTHTNDMFFSCFHLHPSLFSIYCPPPFLSFISEVVGWSELLHQEVFCADFVFFPPAGSI